MANDGVEITPENAQKYNQFPDPLKVDSTPGYSQVKNLNGTKRGHGIISIGGQHTVSYYGKSNNGTVYVASKDGRFFKLQVYSLKQTIKKFNVDQGTNYTIKDVRYYKKD